MDHNPQTWEERITLFAGFLVSNGLKSATIRTYLSAIKAILQENNIAINQDQFALNALTRACRLKNDKFVTRLPISKDMLRLMMEKIDKQFSSTQPYLACLHRAMFSTAHYGLLRAGEVAKGLHVMLANNIHIGLNKNKILIILETSKTHTKGDKPQRIKIAEVKSGHQRNAKCCPFKVLKDYLNQRPAAKQENEQFFVFSDNSPVSAPQLRLIFKKFIKAIGLQSQLYNIHSFRIGRSSDLFKLGVSVETIKKIGRWKSNAIFKYLRD